MPDLLILSNDNKSCFELEDLGRQWHFRVKSTVDAKIAKEWLRTKSFDVVFVANDFPVSAQEQLAEELWAANAVAPYVVFDLNTTTVEGIAEQRLFGAEIARGPQAQQALAQVLERVRSHASPAVQPFRIMVVEDLDSPRDIICSFVESLGLAVVSGFSSAKEALAELEQNPCKYSCIITDVRMPEINGIQLTQVVRRNPKLKTIPVVALTAHGTADCLIDALRAGVSGFLTKPPKRKDLIREIGRAFRLVARGSDPRLATHDEVEQVQEMLLRRGW